MRTAGNVIWFVLFGWHIALTWLVAGLIFAITIIGLPLTRAALEMAKMSAFPFGKEIVHIRDIDQKEVSSLTVMTGTVGLIFNILWAITFGVLLFFYYIVAGVLACLTILLIPFGLQCFKLAAMSIWPVGRRVVSKEVAELVRQEKAAAYIAKHLSK
jgi:uncharacterized membrane protein YccF (DUF307 family)